MDDREMHDVPNPDETPGAPPPEEPAERTAPEPPVPEPPERPPPEPAVKQEELQEQVIGRRIGVVERVNWERLDGSILEGDESVYFRVDEKSQMPQVGTKVRFTKKRTSIGDIDLGPEAEDITPLREQRI